LLEVSARLLISLGSRAALLRALPFFEGFEMFQMMRRVRVLALAGLVLGTAVSVHAANETDADAPSQQALAVAAQAEARSADIEEVRPSEYNGDLRDLQQSTFTPPRYWHMWNEFEGPRRIKPPSAARGETADVQQAQAPLAAMPAPTRNFAGLGFSDAVTGGTAGAGWPPDVNGAVGPTVYIQAVNDAFAIYDKSTGSRQVAFTEDSLWGTAGTGTPCHGSNEGDPIVIYDGVADRWILTDFAFNFDSGGNPVAPFYQCLAVSMTSNPVSGGWFFYAVHMDTGAAGAPPVGTLNDYPKFGVWTDCVYMGANGFNATTGAYAGAIFAAFNRTALYAGQALTSTNSSLGFLSGSSTPFSLFPANLLGTSSASLPPAGTPEYFVAESGSAFAWEVRKFVQGANTCGAGSTLSAATNVNHASFGYPATGTGAAFTTDLVAQKNTTNTLDTLGDRVMQNVQYRKVGSAESLWVVHTTCGSAQDASGECATSTTTTKPQWSQINVTNKVISTTPVQQQIYAPDTTTYRWMGSLAVDAQGNMALGYSMSSSTAFPSIAYSGRLAGDTLNQLPQTETVLQAGAGSQVNAGSGGGAIDRWGDYSAMSIDPADDCTFWYTNEYFDTAAHGTSGVWQTRIGAFKFPGCAGQSTPAKLVFTQQPNASYASGAAITVKVSVEDTSGNVVTTDTSAVTLALSGGTAGATLGGTKTVNAVAGVATFSNLTVNKVGSAYVLNASDAALTAAVSNGFAITAGAASNITFSTQPGAGSNVAAVTAIPLVAHVQDAGGNPVSGQSVTLSLATNPGSSTLTVTANPIGTDVSGNATFANVSLNKIGTGYAFKATDNSTPLNVTGNAFNIVAGAATAIAFSTQPAVNANIAAGATIPLTTHLTDAGGNAVSGHSIQLSFGANPGSAALTVTANPVGTDASGNSTFGNVSLNKIASGYTLKVTDNSAPAVTATGNAFNIVAGAPTQLKFVQQPGNGVAGIALSPSVTVQVLDAQNNVVAADNNAISLTVSAGGFDPGATISAPLVSGIATFGNLVFDVAGAGYQLTAHDAGDTLTSSPSTAFAIAAGAPRLIFSTEPADVVRGSALGTIAVTEDDGSGNVVPDSASSVDFTIAACGGTVDLGSVPMTNGVATLNVTQPFYTLASGLTINARTGVLNGTSRTFKVFVGGDLLFTDNFEGCRL
jgi:hypothetical protein